MESTFQIAVRSIRHNATMTFLCQLLGCSQQTYSRYESHTTEIPLESLIFLADYYDTSVDYLLGITEQDVPYPRKNVK